MAINENETIPIGSAIFPDISSYKKVNKKYSKKNNFPSIGKYNGIETEYPYDTFVIGNYIKKFTCEK